MWPVGLVCVCGVCVCVFTELMVTSPAVVWMTLQRVYRQMICSTITTAVTTVLSSSYEAFQLLESCRKGSHEWQRVRPNSTPYWYSHGRAESGEPSRSYLTITKCFIVISCIAWFISWLIQSFVSGLSRWNDRDGISLRPLGNQMHRQGNQIASVCDPARDVNHAGSEHPVQTVTEQRLIFATSIGLLYNGVWGGTHLEEKLSDVIWTH